MAKSAGGAPSGRDELPQHPYVERLKPDPSKPAKRVIVLTGLPSNSDRAGYQRLYLTTKLDYYAEFLASDKVYSEAVGADQSPFPGHQATRVSVSRDATIHYIWARSPQSVDQFYLDIRLGAPSEILSARAIPTGATCAGTCEGTCQVTCGNPHCAPAAIDAPAVTEACIVLHPDYVPPRDDR